MPRATKPEWDAHNRAEEMIFGSDRKLSLAEIEFILENWMPYIGSRVDVSGAFFTPLSLARCVALNTGDRGRFVDICAGIGALSFPLIYNTWGYRQSSITEVVAVELDYRFVEIGRRILPEVTWVHGDVFDAELWERLGCFNHAVSNPPFGRNKANTGKGDWLSFRGANDFMVLEVAMRVADTVTMIVPQSNMPLHYQRSYGSRAYERVGLADEPETVRRWYDLFPDTHISCSNFDMGDYGPWRSVDPRVELLDIEYPSRLGLYAQPLQMAMF